MRWEHLILHTVYLQILINVLFNFFSNSEKLM